MADLYNADKRPQLYTRNEFGFKKIMRLPKVNWFWKKVYLEHVYAVKSCAFVVSKYLRSLQRVNQGEKLELRKL